MRARKTRRHLSTWARKTREHVSTQEKLARQHVFSTQGMQFSKLYVIVANGHKFLFGLYATNMIDLLE